MRKNFGAKPYLCPQGVFILGSYDEAGNANAMNAAWGGVAGEDRIFLCVGSHKTTENLLRRGAFTVSIGTEEQLIACDYVGMVSATKDPEKMEKSGLHPVKSEWVDAPLFKELPLALECRLLSYDPETCALFGQVVNVSAEESILGEDGRVDIERLRPIIYDEIHTAYHAVGRKVGNAFHDGAALKE